MKFQAVIKKCPKKDKDDRPDSEQQWCLYDSKGEKLLGRHPSKEKALDQEQAIQIHKHQSIEKIAKEILAGRWQPTIDSSKRTTIVLDKRDFKNPSIFNSFIDQLGLDDAFYKKVKDFESDEPDPDLDFYNSIEISIVKSKLE